MIKITATVDGMRCGMCEAHVNDTVRREFDVKKVTASHTKRLLTIITEKDIDEKALADAVNQTGYEISNIRKEPYEKKGFLSGLFK